MGYSQATKSVHLSYETVNTEDGKPFSSRQLNGLQLFDLKKKNGTKGDSRIFRTLPWPMD